MTKYYLYHIPGKKIGVTCDLNNRVTVQQGYGPDEYEVLDESKDIDYISDREIELQKEYGYKVDRKLYKYLKPKTNMRINVTEQTTTFPCPKSDLKKNLLRNSGLVWETEHGEFQINEHTISWILENAKTSMYNDQRCYIYNKAFAYNFPKDYIVKDKNSKKSKSIFSDIRKWAKVRGIYDSGDQKTQYIKLQEEAGELAKAILNKDKAEVEDAIGDMVVVLTNLAELSELRIEDCIDSAYKEISNRKGKMINGTFVKTDGLSEAEITLLMDEPNGN
jgi:NTP pyrophosphatase (non-canonical NTP hydrolase)